MELQVHLSGEQLQSLQNGDSVQIEDAGLKCVILRADVFEKIKALVFDEADLSDDELRALAARAAQDADTAGPIP
jgi:hypothetical protein